MADYQLVIHLRDAAEPTLVPLPGLSEQEAEHERQTLIYDLDQARLAEAPVFSVRSGDPDQPLDLDPHRVTEVDLVEGSGTED